MEIKYDNQELEWSECLTDKEKKKHSQNWLRKDTLDHWRHKRMLKPLKAFIQSGDKWLTIGDGRYGTEANFLLSNGVYALATDLSDKLLKVGNKIGFIKDYKKENAESLSFNDNEFDYVLIKEAFHHFPRPWLALYESFRVAKKGVILIEPNDQFSSKVNKRIKLIKSIYIFFKSIKGNPHNKDDFTFEEVGNFIYTTNTRELEKFLLGMHYRHFGNIPLNDHYFSGIEYINLFDKKLINKLKILKLKSIVYLKEFLFKLGFINNSLNINILFKEAPDKKLLSRMKLYGWKYKKLPLNPYI